MADPAIFSDLWLGDRFTVRGTLWTKLAHDLARRHSEESIALDAGGHGYMGDTVCSFASDDQVEFVPPVAPTTAQAAQPVAMPQLSEPPMISGEDARRFAHVVKYADAMAWAEQYGEACFAAAQPAAPEPAQAEQQQPDGWQWSVQIRPGKWGAWTGCTAEQAERVAGDPDYRTRPLYASAQAAPAQAVAVVQEIEAAIDRIEAVINQRREPGWSYRNTITTNRNTIREQCAKLRGLLAAQPVAADTDTTSYLRVASTLRRNPSALDIRKAADMLDAAHYELTAARSADTCRKCGGTLKPGKAIAEAFSSSDEGTVNQAARVGHAPMENCLKCEACGWSVTTGGTGAEADAARIVWPKEKRVGRLGDMTPPGDSILTVGLDSDNDVYVEVWNDERRDAQRAAIEFCNGGGGGGQSPRTRAALINLMSAIEADNAAAPHKAERARKIIQENGNG